MKAKKTLWIALGLASSAMLAQAQTSTGPDTSNQYQGQTQTMPQTPAPVYPQQQVTPQTGDTSQQQPAPSTGNAPDLQIAPSIGNAPQQQITPSTGAAPRQQTAPSLGAEPSQQAPAPSMGTGSSPQQPVSPSSSGSSASQPSTASVTDNAAAPSVVQLQPKTENGVTYLCGGVGLDEAQMIKSEARNYDLMLTFAARDGSYLADVNVEIADARGTPVLTTKCDAPILLVDLPKSGNYRIRSETEGRAVSRTAYVQNKKGHSKSLAVVWPQTAVTSTGSSSPD